MAHRVKSWLVIPFRWIFQASDIKSKLRIRVRTKAGQDAPACETLEGRVVLSNWGNSLVQSLESVRVVLGPVVVADPSPPTRVSQAPQLSKLQADEQSLQAELQGLAAKSGVTVADVDKVGTDSRAFAQAGYWFEGQGLEKAVTELAMAVAGGGDTTQARDDFNALFNGSSVPQSAVDAAFDDLAQIIKDSGVTPMDLTAVANDEAAIQTDKTS
jgi:hypothetical protein